MGCIASKEAPPAPRTTSITGGGGGGGSSSGVASDASTSNGSDGAIQYRVELSSYEEACLTDPQIQSFDEALQQRTTRAITTIAVDAGVSSISLDSLTEVTGCLFDTNQDVVRLILENKKEIWKNPELFGLVKDYIETSFRTLDFCLELDKCLKRARDRQMIVQLALKRFEEEEKEKEEEDDPNRENKYLNTLEELRSFKDAGDPFTEEFFKVFQSVRDQQLALMRKLQNRRRKLDKKLKSMQAWRTISSVIFVSTAAAILICSVVAAAISAPPAVVALAGAVTVAMGPMGKWFDSLWRGYMDVRRGERKIVGVIEAGTFFTLRDLESIRVLVDRFEIEIQSMLNNASFALRGDHAVKIGVDEMSKKLDEFMKCVDDLEKQAYQCRQFVTQARAVVLQNVMRHPQKTL